MGVRIERAQINEAEVRVSVDNGQCPYPKFEALYGEPLVPFGEVGSPPDQFPN